MTLKEKIKKKFNEYLFWCCLCFTLDGILTLIVTAVVMNSYVPPYSVVNYCLWCFQRYSILFLPMLMYVGFKYKDRVSSDKVVKLAVFGLVALIVLLEFISYFYYWRLPHVPTYISGYSDYSSLIYQVGEWGLLFTVLFVVFVKSKFSLLFSFGLSYIFTYLADILFELPKTGGSYFVDLKSLFLFEPAFGAFFLLMLIIGFTLHKLNFFKVDIRRVVVLLVFFVPLLFSWVYFYPIWSIKTEAVYFYPSNVPRIEPFDRLFAFPFVLAVGLMIYLDRRNKKNA